MTFKEKADSFLQNIDLDLRIIYLAIKDPATSRIIKIIAGFFIALALSPVDLIPDFIPVLGLLDDIIIIPLGILTVKKLLPREMIEKYREEALDLRLQKKQKGLYTVLAIWLITLMIILYFLFF